MFVGGEFYDDPAWEKDSPTLDTAGMTFLSGGKACLMVICDYLLDHGIQRILLPSYLCPTVLATLERQGIDWEMYPVREDFSIDLDDLARRTAGFRAVYFINYFGFQHSPETRHFFQSLRRNGVVVVEDNAQTGFAPQTTGDFVFNSLRKFTAHDGGYLISSHDVTPHLEKYRGIPNRRLPLIRAYRSGLRRYLFEDADNYDELQSLFERTETVYASDSVVWGDPQEQAAIERMDWQGIRRVRRENYRYLLKLISTIPEVRPIFPALQEDNMPLGLPVYISRVSRDRVNDELGDSQIGLTIHWDEILTHPYAHSQPLAADMASRILTLTIDQRTSRAQLEYLALHLVRAVENAKMKQGG